MFSLQCIAANAGRSLASAAFDITPTADAAFDITPTAEMELKTIENNSHSSVPAIAPATAPFEQQDSAVVPLGRDGSTAAIVTGNDILTGSNEVVVRLDRPRQVNSISALPTQDQNPDVPVTLAAVTLAAAAAAAAPPAQGMDRMFNKIFNLHNQYRALHKARPLTWSSSLASQAAQHAARCSLAHDRVSGVADNLFAISETHSPAGYLVAAIDMWYAENKKYNYAKPDFSTATGHFTQVVWQGTKKLGCAVKSCPNGIENSGMAKGTLVVCQYSPPGNLRGAYADNVLPRRRQANPPAQPAPQDRLPAGAKLTSPSCLLSSDKRFQLCLRDSGLLVLTQVDIKPHLPLWSSSGQSTMTKPFTATVGPSGALKVMDSKQRLVWKSSPARNSAAGPFAAVVQNDGLLVVLDARGATVWNSQSVM